jgi:hypothetical protein
LRGVNVVKVRMGYSESEFLGEISLQLCLEISVSSNSRNLLQFLQFDTVHCKEKGRKPDRRPYPLPYGLRNPYRNLKSENSQVMPRNLNEIDRS